MSIKMDEQELLSKLIGMTETQGVELIKSEGYVSRVTNIDGKPYMITHDFRTDRINLQLETELTGNHGPREARIIKANLG